MGALHDVGKLPIADSQRCRTETYNTVSKFGEPFCCSGKELPLIDSSELSITIQMLFIQNLENWVQ